MKFTNEEMYHYVNIMEGLEEKKKLGYAIARNRRKMKDCVADYMEIKNQALQKYGRQIKISDAQTRFIVEGDNRALFEAEVGELQDIEHDCDIYQISEDEFISGNLTSGQMEALIWMVEE